MELEGIMLSEDNELFIWGQVGWRVVQGAVILGPGPMPRSLPGWRASGLPCLWFHSIHTSHPMLFWPFSTFYFFKDFIYLFVRDTERERQRHSPPMGLRQELREWELDTEEAGGG
uniref:Uncharacterized protein n=1 Tax=Canis lupus dingo TaxID=286419 RepID=A0A8C0K5Q8_CANLU